MNRILTILFLLITFHSKAQYVTIPDINLRTALETYFPQCIKDGLLDTLIAGSLTEKGLGIEGLDIRSLEGMQYFKTFTSLYCGDNLLTDLKFLPPNITWLNAPGNQINSIDSLPQNLEYLDLNYNTLSSLPELPSSLKILLVNNNPELSCLPLLPSGLEELYIYQTDIQCIPNKPNALTANYTLCTPVNNRHHCQALPVISGRVFVDINKNGIKDLEEPYRKGIKVMIASEGLYTFSDDFGYYEISVPKVSSYEISISNSYYSAIPATVTLINTGQPNHYDIALQIVQEVKDLAVTVINYNFARPGFDIAFKIELDNIGSEAGPAEVLFTIPQLYTIDSSSVTGTFQSGVISWNYPNLLPGEHKAIMIYGKLNASAVLGETLNITVQINPEDTQEHNVTNNIAILRLTIRGAYDPNDKQGPDKITPIQVSAGEYLYYTIRFQNTGTDTAFTVIIADPLDLKLQATTVDLLSSSHNCHTTIRGEQLYFTFEHIQLPDSNTNMAASCGYVYFRIRPITTLTEGENILNHAEIYFDYNSPVITNTVQTVIKEDILTDMFPKWGTTSLQIYPNPVTNGAVHISTGAYYKIFNHHGTMVGKGISDGNPISLHSLPAGLYMIEMNVGKIYETAKIIVSN